MVASRIPRLRTVWDIPTFLGSFFATGRAASDLPVEVTEGLWTLLSWCWQRTTSKRQASPLCRALIAKPGSGWWSEDDVLDAMARGLDEYDPSRVSPCDVHNLVRAFLEEGEIVRGQGPRLDLRLEFVLPPITSHPLYRAERIVAALERDRGSRVRLQEHLDTVHPERRPYRGAWRVSLRDRLHTPETVDHSGGDAITIENDRIGAHSRATLALEYEPDFAGYFRLSVQDVGSRTFDAARGLDRCT